MSSDREIPGLENLEVVAAIGSNRASAWRRFVDKVERHLRSVDPRKQPQIEIDNLLEAGVSDPWRNLDFNHELSVTEVIKDGMSQGWDITYNCLCASSGHFAPFDPPDDRDYYLSREQALIALVGWLNEKSQESYEILMGDDSGDNVNVQCPGCKLDFLVDSDGIVLENSFGAPSDEPERKIHTHCPECGLPFEVDSDGDILETYPGDRDN